MSVSLCQKNQVIFLSEGRLSGKSGTGNTMHRRINYFLLLNFSQALPVYSGSFLFLLFTLTFSNSVTTVGSGGCSPKEKKKTPNLFCHVNTSNKFEKIKELKFI